MIIIIVLVLSSPHQCASSVRSTSFCLSSLVVLSPYSSIHVLKWILCSRTRTFTLGRQRRYIAEYINYVKHNKSCVHVYARKIAVLRVKIVRLRAVFHVRKWQKSTGLHSDVRRVTQNVLHGIVGSTLISPIAVCWKFHKHFIPNILSPAHVHIYVLSCPCHSCLCRVCLHF